MTRNSQKQEEKYFAGVAAKLLNKSWRIKEAPDEREWPDLIVTEGDASFGLEVRNVYLDEGSSGSKKKQDEVYRSNLISNLAKKYYSMNGVPVSLKINGELSKELFTDMVNCINRVSKDLDDFEVRKQKIGEGKTIIYITKVLDELGEYDKWQYVGDSVGWVSEITDDHILELINSKNKNFDNYTKNISDVRLLLVANRLKNSGRAVFAQGVRLGPLGFSGAYLLSYPDEVNEIM